MTVDIWECVFIEIHGSKNIFLHISYGSVPSTSALAAHLWEGSNVYHCWVERHTTILGPGMCKVVPKQNATEAATE
eukprot:5887454-Amphidinium_carterae.1